MLQVFHTFHVFPCLQHQIAQHDAQGPDHSCPQCSLGEEGAVAIADFVKKAKKLKELNLYMNDIGNGGAYKVATHPVI